MAGLAARGRTALVLGGGGVTGGWFELGALRALDAVLWPRSVTDLDIVVGVSCGSVVGSQVAAGIAPHRLVAGLNHRGAEVAAPFRRRDILRPNWRELAARTAVLPRRVLDGLWAAATGDPAHGPLDTLFTMGEVIPASIFDGGGLERFVRGNLLGTPCQDRFESLSRELYVVAVDVDTHDRAVFGAADRRGANISRAVRASSSFPPAFAPCRIDGHDYVDGGIDKNFHLDIAVAAGATLVLCVNPLLPLFNDPAQASVRRMDGKAGHIVDKGMPGVVDQAVRMILHSRMVDSVADTRRDFPDVDVLMLEPAPDDYAMWFYNVGRFSARLATARLGYLATHARMAADWDKWSSTFDAHGLAVRRDILDNEAERLRAVKVRRRPVLELLGAPPCPA